MRKRREKVDYSAEMNKHDSPAVQLLFVALGTLFVLLGVAGAFLPVLPTTPFMLLAAGCYARASTRSNDHPVNFTYNTALATADGGLRDPATTPAVAALIPGGPVQCSSCHTTHDPTKVPFLRVSNAASALCLTCHIK